MTKPAVTGLHPPATAGSHIPSRPAPQAQRLRYELT